MLNAARDAVPNLQLVDTESPRVKELAKQCTGRTPVLVSPSLYTALTLTFPLDVSGINTTLGRINKELGQDNLGQAVGKLLPEYFEPARDSPSQKDMSLRLANFNVKGLRDLLRDLESLTVDLATIQETRFTCFPVNSILLSVRDIHSIRY